VKIREPINSATGIAKILPVAVVVGRKVTEIFMVIKVSIEVSKQLSLFEAGLTHCELCGEPLSSLDELRQPCPVFAPLGKSHEVNRPDYFLLYAHTTDPAKFQKGKAK
jgi:hypothetical protein